MQIVRLQKIFGGTDAGLLWQVTLHCHCIVQSALFFILHIIAVSNTNRINVRS